MKYYKHLVDKDIQIIWQTGIHQFEEIKKTATTVTDSKTRLQEYSLKLSKNLPTYNVLSLKGPEHRPLYKASVKIKNSKTFYGIGNSKKEAQLKAAEKLLKVLDQLKLAKASKISIANPPSY